ncbi:MAG: GIY-YIG nuclease family protein, partial [Pseudomonadota bacterium]
MPIDRNHIIAEIKRIAQADGGKAPGRQKFERETNITMKEWYGVHWARWGDALLEAGYEPNTKQAKLSTDEVLTHFASAVRHFKRIPSDGDLRIFGRNTKGFPGHTTFNNHFGSKRGTVEAFRIWLEAHSDYSDLMEFMPEKTAEYAKAPQPIEGFVYLLKSGTHFKIGRSDNLE